MKSFLLSLLFLAVTSITQATVRIADNNANRPTAASGVFIYSGLQDAITASTSGDTILVIPSTATYGAINTFGKSGLTIIGMGFNPDSKSGLTSKVSSLTIYDNSTGLNFIGLEITTVSFTNNQNQSLSNVVIENCSLTTVSNSILSMANIFIRQNVIRPSTTNALSITAGTQSNVIISNNIFVGNDDTNDGLINITTGGATIDHNLFLGTGNTNSKAFETLNNCTVSNNIFYGRGPDAEVGMSSVTFENNLFYQTSVSLSQDSDLLGLGTNNSATGNIFSDPQFEDIPAVGPSLVSWDYNYDANLKAGSPALSAGNDVTPSQRDLGIYGGSSPFKDSGSVVPIVKSLLLPTTIQQGTNTTADIVVTGN